MIGWSRTSFHCTFGKTESILFGSKQKIKRNSKLNISCNGVSIVAKESLGYLGDPAWPDTEWRKFVQKGYWPIKLTSKISVQTSSSSQPFSWEDTIVTALIQCGFDYAVLSYFGLSKISKSKLQTCQNKLICFVLGLGPHSHLMPCHFRKIWWLPTEQRVAFSSVTPCVQDLKQNLKHGFIRVADSHTHFTRFSQQSFVVPRFGTHGQKSFIVNALRQWKGLQEFN